MTSKEIESNVKRIFENFSKDEFISNLLIAHGISIQSRILGNEYCFKFGNIIGLYYRLLCKSSRKRGDG